jgi:hypothetical protein
MRRAALAPGNMKGIGAVENGRERILRAMAEIRFDARRWLAQVPASAEGIQRVILAGPPVNSVPAGTAPMQALRLLTQDPAYQLK